MSKLNYTLEYEFFRRFDPYHSYLKQAIRTALACLLAIVIYRSLPQFQQAYWAILTASFIIQTRIGNQPIRQLGSVLVCGILASIAAYIAIIASINTYALAFYLALIGAIIVLYGARGHNAIIRVFFIGLFAIMSGGLALHGDPAYQRSLFILAGTLIALISSCLWLTSPAARFKKAYEIYLHSVIESIYQQTFLILLTQYSAEKIEARLHERRNRLLRQLKQLRDIAHTAASKQNYQDLALAENLWKLAIGFGNLRHLFADNEQEMQQLFQYAQQKLAPVFYRFLHERQFTVLSATLVEKPSQQVLIDYYADRLISIFIQGGSNDG